MFRQIISSLSVLSILSTAAFSASAKGIDYAKMESIANAILCEKESRCEDTQLSAKTSQTELFVVDGVTLPPDALRDEDQQRSMISASLYVTQNGDVSSLPSESETLAAAAAKNQEKAERRKVLPVKMFPAPEITPQETKVVISVK